MCPLGPSQLNLHFKSRSRYKSLIKLVQVKFFLDRQITNVQKHVFSWPNQLSLQLKSHVELMQVKHVSFWAKSIKSHFVELVQVTMWPKPV